MNDTASRKHPAARPPYRQPQRLDGSPACRWCWGKVPKGRRCWCSQACVDEYRLEHDWQFAVNAVRKRDHGVCVLCGADTYWLQNALRHLYDFAKGEDETGWWLVKRHPLPYSRIGWLAHVLTGRSFYGQPWEADHIVARADGGSGHPSNLRTLCVPCHKARTALQHKERAARRRASS